MEINLLSKEQQALNEAIFQFNVDLSERSFSNRHPELGRMFKCQVCKTRHRPPVCKQRFALDENDEPRLASGWGRGKGRTVPRPNPVGLQIIELTRKIFPKYEHRMEPVNAVKAARTEAYRTIKTGKRKIANRLRKIQKESRAINRA